MALIIKMFVRGILFQSFVAEISATKPVVNTTLGKVEGIQQTVLGKTINTFYGIPFAKPPLGDLRFKRPEPAVAWGEEVKNATTPKNSCIQDLSLRPSLKDAISEDCLYLNIWTPADQAGNLSTLVWIYGGAFVKGSISEGVYQGDLLAAENDVIVASMNYRLGALGFFYTGSDAAPGNQGMLDQVLGLKWIHENIERFGGNPAKISLFGGSAGAASVNHHLFSHLSRDLFQYAIIQSGTSEALWATVDQSTLKSTSLKLAKDLGCRSEKEVDMIRCMTNISTQSIIEKQQSTLTLGNPTPWAPVVDRYFLPSDPRKMLESGDVKNTSIIIGVNKNEGSFFLWRLFPTPDSRATFRKGFLLAVNATATLLRDFTLVPAIINEYELSIVPSQRQVYFDLSDKLFADFGFICPASEFATSYSKLGNKVFMYSLQYRPSVCPFYEYMGVTHSCDLELIFGHMRNGSLNFTVEDKAVSTQVQKYWTTFAKTGDPNNAVNSTNWPLFTGEETKYLDLDLNSSTQQGLRYRQCLFWNTTVPLLTKLRGAAGANCEPCRANHVSSLRHDVTFYSLFLINVFLQLCRLR